MIIQKRYLFWLVFLFLFFITVQSQDASAQLLPIDSSCVNSGYICDNCSSITWDCFDIGSCTNIPIASRPYYCLAPWMNYCANNYSCGCNYTQVVRIFYPDTDGDGYGAGTSVLKCYDGITVPPGFSLNNLDCNNNNASIYPGAVEKCNNVDDNCNGVTDEGCDDDADTYADSSMVCEGSFRDDLNNLQLCSTHGGDCDDGNLNIHPGAPEICNNIDESCNGVKDDGCDDDGDTYPDCSMSCTTQDYWSTGNNSLRECGVPADCDCDDNNIALWFWRNYYVDSDGDGYGCGNLVSVCSGNGPPPGYSASNGDCNCTNPTVWTLMFAYNDTDRDDYGCGGLVNQSCSNGTTPPAGYTLTPGDCDCNVYSCNNGANNCSIMSYLDFDNDSFGNATVSHRKCDALANYVLNNTDCDDSVFFCNAGANNCTAINYLDTDQDRYCDSPTVSLRRCDAPPLYNVTNISMCTDCNNTNQLIWRNGSFYRDFDNDTFGVNPSLNICYGLLDPPSGYSYNNTDCDDSVFSCNAGTNNCSIMSYLDFDNDSFGNATVSHRKCDALANYVLNNTDCDDSVFFCNAGANNCTAINYLDTDQDRYCDSPTVSLRRCDAPPLYNVTNISMCTDCNNTNQLIWRNGSFYRDFDNDTFGVNPSLNICYGLLDPPSGYSYNNTDCDDSVFSCNTGANNCTAMNYLDTDQDRYCDSPTVSLRRCDAPPLYNVTNISMCTDCNNTNQLIWRNGTFCVNKDGDAYGLPPLVIVCYGALDPPINYSYSCVDCDDSVPNTWGVGNLVVKYKGSTVAAIDNYGVLALKGGVSVVDPITGIPPSFNVKDDVGDVVSAITSAGDLYTILGVTNMFSSPIVPTASQDLIIKRSGTNLAMFTKRGAVQVRCVMPNFNFSGTPIG